MPDPPVIVVFDVDECLGSFDQPIQLYHEIMENTELAREQRERILTEVTPQIVEGLQEGNLRPGIGRVFRFLNALKHQKLLDHVVLFTNASNEFGWVDYLSDLLEELTESPSLITTIIARETEGRNMRTPSHFERQAKHLSDLAKFIGVPNVDLSRVIMFDDHIDSIVPNNAEDSRGNFVRVAQQVPEQEIFAEPSVQEPFLTEIRSRDNLKEQVDYIESAVKPSAEQRPLSSYKDDIKIFIVPLVHFFLRNRVSPSVLRKALKEGGFSPEKMMPAPMASAAAGGTRRRRRRLHGSRKTPRRFH